MQWFHRRSTKCGRGRGSRGRRRCLTNSARISHPPPFRRVTKNDELLAAFDRAEIRPYQIVPRAQIVTNETDKSGGSEESDDEVGAVDGSGIARGARSERTGNRSSLDLPYTDYSRTSSNKIYKFPQIKVYSTLR